MAGNQVESKEHSELIDPNEPPKVTATLGSIEDLQHSDVVIRYHLDDKEKESLSIICEYLEAEDGKWQSATITYKTRHNSIYSVSFLEIA